MVNRVLVVVVAGLLFLGGCAAEKESISAPFAVVVDQVGREVTVGQAPARIISLSPGNTEIAFALGLADRVAGLTDFCNYPPEAKEKAKVGGFSKPSLEKILELEPDLVLAGTMHEEMVAQLEELGLAVLVLAPGNLEEIYGSLMLVATVTGNTAEGEALVKSMRERVEGVRARLASVKAEDKPRVYYEVYSDPLMSAGAATVINEIITLAGGVNIFSDVAERYPKVSAEVVVERQPQVILFPNFHGSADLMLEKMADRPGWESIPAVRENRAYAVTDDSFARPGPRVVDAVEEAARLFYPGLF